MFAIKIKTTAQQDVEENGREIDELYIGLVTISILPKRLFKKDISKQILLTEELDEAETYDSLAKAQEKVQILQNINDNFHYLIFEIN